MKFTVTGRKLKITDAIRDHLEQKVERHITPWAKEGDLHVALAVEKHGHFAEITAKLKGYTVHSEHETEDLYSAIDMAVEKIEKQIKKHKDRAQSVKAKQNHQQNAKY